MSYKVLIVDDDPDYAGLLSKYLDYEGIDCTICDNGQLALELVHRTHPDLVILEALLPERNGFEVCDAIKSHEATRDIPLMMVTSYYVSDDDKERGIDLAMGKPVDRDDFVRKVRSLLGDSTAHVELERNRKPRLLVADDDPGSLLLLQKAFSKQQYAVYSAVNAAQALDIFRSDHPDVVILDVRLPDMSGLEVCGIMKRERPNVAVVLITAYGSELIAVEAMRKNADDYLSKPLNLAETAAVVAENLRKSHLRRERDMLAEQVRRMNAALLQRYEELLAARAELEKYRREAGPGEDAAAKAA